MMSLFVPWTILLVLICLATCLWKKWYKFSACLFVLVVLLNYFWSVFAFELNYFCQNYSDNSIRVMTWNVRAFDSADSIDVEGIVSTIIRENADFVFLTEYKNQDVKEIDSLLSNQYPYKGNIDNEISYSELYSKLPLDKAIIVNDGYKGCLLRYSNG